MGANKTYDEFIKSDKRLRFIGIYQIVGGIGGIVTAIILQVLLGNLTVFLLAIIPVTLLSVLSILLGRGLLRGS